ncbi:hypothetical protein ABIB49_003452 [Arthrobacter sp. UYCu512]|uniref:hypothetical protein n=1 Tax=Arthrobacter sp. UYCu512 TaxID=3156338 RepID=UPI003395926B
MTFKATQAQGTPRNFKLTGDLTIKNTTCRWSSQRTNTKLWALAAELTETATAGQIRQTLEQWGIFTL